MRFDSCWLLIRAGRLSTGAYWLTRALLLLPVAILSVIVTASWTPSLATGQSLGKRNILILTEVSSSHPLTAVIARQIATGLQGTPGNNAEVYLESLDLLSLSHAPLLADARNWLITKYGGLKIDVIVAIGPETIQFLANQPQPVFGHVPIVICGSSEEQAAYPKLDSRFTGTWQMLEPMKTLEMAMRLFPDTRHVFVVGGSSIYDKVALADTKASLSSFQSQADLTYLTDLEMDTVMKRLRDLPEHSVVFYISFFQDASGNKFINATQALPMVAEAAKAPVFGLSDTYLGHGIAGGDVMDFQEQGLITSRIVSELLGGKKPSDLPITSLPSAFMFDWNQLQRWHIPEERLPQGSVVLFREPTRWESTRRIWISALLIFFVLSAAAMHLLHDRRHLRAARVRQRELSGMLINAEERERRRLASELHDDFSQRLAVVALEAENVDEAVPASLREVHEQLRHLIHATTEIGTDLHTLSHRLHSSTLGSLGLLPALTALCKEFSKLQDVNVILTSDNVPRSIHPDTALCVFRIVQEALRNFKKYSGVTEARVHVSETRGHLRVVIRDEGRGFDLRDPRRKGGLGILSMEERARLLDGEFKLRSALGKGTTVEA